MRVSLVVLFLLFCSPVFASDDICRALMVRHTPNTDVEHVGDAEVPADLNAVSKPILSPILIPITLDLAERYALNIPDDIQLEPDIAMIEIYVDGRVLYNGQDISSRAQDICGESKGTDGQAGEDVLKSAPNYIEVREGIQGEILEGEYWE